MSDKLHNLVRPKSFLRLVGADAVSNDAFLGDSCVQMGLFPVGLRRVASFFHFSYFLTEDFISVFSSIKPGLIFDLRVSPSFRNMNVERRRAISIIEGSGARYLDVSGMVGARDYPNFVGDTLGVLNMMASSLVESKKTDTSLMIICDDSRGMDCYVRDFNSVVGSEDVKFQIEVFVGGRSW